MTIELRGVAAGYGRRRVLDDLSLSVADGEILALVGVNGSGKSTLLKVMARLLRPLSGGVYWNGSPVAEWSTSAWAKACAFLPQEHPHGRELTVEELVGHGRFPHRRAFRGLDRRDKEAVERALVRTRADGLRHRLVGTLSGGERQRAWLAMALAREPSLLLLDEPTTFLDVRGQCEMADLLRALNRETGLTIVLVLHDLNLAARCAHRLAVLKDRGLGYWGPPDAILTPAVLADAFGVSANVARAADGLPYYVPMAPL